MKANVDMRICVNCDLEYPARRKGSSSRLKSVKNVRASNSVTCSRKCARKHLEEQQRFYSSTHKDYYQKWIKKMRMNAPKER